MAKVKVVIPIYKSHLSAYELHLLEHNLRVLAAHDIAFLLPESLSTKTLARQFDINKYENIRVSDEYLGSKNGRRGYNAMMMSADFYSLFNDVEYILICQTDVYIFRDELLSWCDKGYDYVGAPWVKRKVYDLPVVRHYLALRLRFLVDDKLNFVRQHRYNKVGNGGLSLRNVARCLDVCRTHSSQIEHFTNQDNHMYNEDVFWAMVPEHFKHPEWQEALNFSFDVYPAYCYELNNYELPMGCHGVSRVKIYNFWRNIISVRNEEFETSKSYFSF